MRLFEIALLLGTLLLIYKSTFNIYKELKAQTMSGSRSDRIIGLIWAGLTMAGTYWLIFMSGANVPFAVWCLLAVGMMGNLQAAYRTYRGCGVPSAHLADC